MISLTSPVETRAHHWPAGLKLALLSGATVALFAVETVLGQALFFATMVALYALPGSGFLRAGIDRLRMLWPFLVLIALWHLAIGELAAGALIALRMVTAVGLANLVTMTTKLSDMLRVIERLCAPLRIFGVRPEPIALAMALVVRFVPVLSGKGHLLVMAWRARAARRVGWRILLPFAVIAIDDAEHVAEALRARGGL
ncbi:MAG: energy-coupling factor transporter transmembrane protein EcfT [Sulfitobacter sp.]|nr:energy-coupling factor transporter transmembrane protein EcfT [Sulfitobacter sp.]